jgi:formylglycine-generating enzyme required for sulfatase activity/serine/threonine protein kinase
MGDESDDDSSWIDDAADRFERDWKLGQTPRIEDHLAGTVGTRRSRLFEELLKLEWELRCRQNDRPDPEEYRHRFPDFIEVIDGYSAGAEEPAAADAIPGEAQTTVAHGSTCLASDGPEPASTLNGPRYRVLRHHADGGIGRVSVALDLEIRRKVALKELHDRFADDPNIRKRFLLEVEVTGRLEHPGVIPVYGLGQDGRGRPFYAMRFIEGEDLGQAIQSFHAADLRPARKPGERALALRQLLRRFVDTCNVVAYAHSRGVLHRDLKPGNILLGPYGETLVVDWGLAKLVDGPLSAVETGEEELGHEPDDACDQTLKGDVLGTIAYMSPEQANDSGGPLGTASDVYSLGATLYHILSGRAPIEKADKYTMLSCARRGEFLRPRQVNQRVPAALEAICLRAMSYGPKDRYPSPRALANDIEHWLADEPVSAWKEPWPLRTRRWVARHRTPVASAAAALAVAALAIGYLLYDSQLRFTARRAQADGLVMALRTAEVKQVKSLVEQLRPFRPMVLERLRSLARPGAPDFSNSHRNAALALLADDPSQADYLIEQILRSDVRPDEIAVMRNALFDHGQASLLTPRLWPLLSEGSRSGSPNLGVAGVLALFAPSDPQWVELGPRIAAELVSKDPHLIAAWREVFQPVQQWLVEPLRASFGDIGRPRERALAYSLLFEFAAQPGNTTRHEDLAELIPDAEPDEFRKILAELRDRNKAVAVLLPKLEGRATPDADTARRRGRIAAALIRLGAPDRAWPLIRRGGEDDAGVRSELIHALAVYQVSLRDVVDRLCDEMDVSARRALILSLGEYPPASLPAEILGSAAKRLRELYVGDGDPGVHSAIDWLRKKWDLGPEFDSLEKSWSGLGVALDRRWFVNLQGVTMAVILVSKPVEFEMGSPKDEDGRDPDERIHRALLDESFAVATREVTVAQFGRYLASDSEGRRFGVENLLSSCPDCPVTGVNWLTAADYCNWLSRCEKLVPYYFIQGTTLSVPDRNGVGYRLPTEREWEYACRAGSRASRPHGGSEALLRSFAWYLPNAEKRSHAVGHLKPNDLGLFDMLGNAFEWTEDRYTRYSDRGGHETVVEGEKAGITNGCVEVVLRGGSFSSPATALRSAYRERSSPSDPLETYGFRYVRTLPPAHENKARDR